MVKKALTCLTYEKDKQHKIKANKSKIPELIYEKFQSRELKFEKLQPSNQKYEKFQTSKPNWGNFHQHINQKIVQPFKKADSPKYEIKILRAADKDLKIREETKIKIFSSNARGLNKNKLYDFLEAYKKRSNQNAFICIQDINTKSNTMLKLKNIAFNNNIHMVNNTSENKVGTGVAILFGKSQVSKFKILFKDSDGRILLIKLWLKDDTTINIASVYGIPNQDTIQNKSFYNNLRIMIEKNNKENLLIAGDFNAVEDVNKDIYTTSKNKIFRSTDDLFRSIMEEHYLEDIHNLIHKETTHFTFFRKNKNDRNYEYKSRLDKVLLKRENNNIKITSHETINNFTKSDHKMIKINISIYKEIVMGPYRNPALDRYKKINFKDLKINNITLKTKREEEFILN